MPEVPTANYHLTPPPAPRRYRAPKQHRRGRILARLLFVIVAVAALLACALLATEAYKATAATCQIPTTPGPAAGTARLTNLPQTYTHNSTDGDLLAVATFSGLAAVGGNFHTLYQDGQPHPAGNFAVVGTVTGRLVYAGQFNSYVRTVAYSAPYLYVGGDFTAPRNRVAQIDTRTWTLTAWNPGSAGQVRTITAGTSRVFYGGAGNQVRAVSPSTGAQFWVKATTGGPTHSTLLSTGQSALYVGGQFETWDGSAARPHLVKVDAATGALAPAFNAKLTPDSGVGDKGTYDGEEAVSLTWVDGWLVDGNGGGVVNSLYVLDAQTGARRYTQIRSEGDNQAVVGTLGGSFVTGFHRNHGNGQGCPVPYFAAQYAPVAGRIALETYWDPGLSGNQANTDGGNNGVTGIANDAVNRRLILVGGFTKHWQSCPDRYTCVDTVNTTSMRSFAVYPYS